MSSSGHPGTSLFGSAACIEFTEQKRNYIRMCHGVIFSPQKTSLSSTVRRLGEELYRPRQHVQFTASTKGGSPQSPNRPKEGAYFRSSNLHIRFLSSLIILKTLSQGTYIAFVVPMAGLAPAIGARDYVIHN
jgi:hypothetical protein